MRSTIENGTPGYGSGLRILILSLALLLPLTSPGEEAPPPSNGNGSAVARVEGAPPPPGQVRSPWADVVRELAATRVSTGPVVDGNLDDEAWKLAPDGGPLVQLDPFEGMEPTQRTAFRVIYDDDQLYLGMWCYDAEPDRIVAAEMARDGRLSEDDHVAFVIDTFHDHRNGYLFRVNPNGARADALVSNNVDLNESWDGIWIAAARIDGEGWKAEIAIPFSSVGFNPDSPTWGFNVFRQIKRISEKNRWVAARPEISTHNVAEAGNLTGLVGLQQGLGLDVTPYGLGRFRYDRETSHSDWDWDAGGDIRYRITPNLSALLSYNTDFAETEVDLRQVNLSRFPLFFPEKRDFFLEDTGIFRFANLGTSLIPFYSRRIGLSEEGEQVPILFAGKVTGRVDSFNIGAIDAVLDSHDDVSARNAFVGRVSRNVLEQSTLGGIVTYGDPNSMHESCLAGTDFGYRTTSLFGDQVLQANAFALGTYTESEDNDNSVSFGGDVSLPNDLYSASAQFFQIGADFHPALGFAPRRSIRAYASSLSYKPRPEAIDFLRQCFFTYSGSTYTDLSNRVETAYHGFYPLYVELESGDYLSVNVASQYDAPEEDFEISPGVVIPAGGYWWSYVRAGLDSASKRRVEVELFYTAGGFYEGEKQSFYSELELKPSRYLMLDLSYSVNFVRLPEGDFNTHLASARAQIGFTPNLIWYNLLQYDNVSSTFGYNSRVSWEFRPGAYFFVVLNQSALKDGSRVSLLETEVVAKLAMTFRF